VATPYTVATACCKTLHNSRLLKWSVLLTQGSKPCFGCTNCSPISKADLADMLLDSPATSCGTDRVSLCIRDPSEGPTFLGRLLSLLWLIVITTTGSSTHAVYMIQAHLKCWQGGQVEDEGPGFICQPPWSWVGQGSSGSKRNPRQQEPPLHCDSTCAYHLTAHVLVT